MTKENCKHNHLIMKDWIDMAMIFEEDSERYVHYFKAKCTDCWEQVLIQFEREGMDIFEALNRVWEIELNEEERIIKITPFEWQNIKIDDEQ